MMELNNFSDFLNPTYYPWLTPDHARRVAEIAREETIEKTLKWLESCRGFILTEMDIEQFKKYMEEQL